MEIGVFRFGGQERVIRVSWIGEATPEDSQCRNATTFEQGPMTMTSLPFSRSADFLGTTTGQIAGGHQPGLRFLRIAL